MLKQYHLLLKPRSMGFHLIDAEISKRLTNIPSTGIVNIFLQHTSASICINEKADADVMTDMTLFFNKLIPENVYSFKHILEGNDDMPAHIKSVLFGQSLNIPIIDNQLALGTWQGIFLCEFKRNADSRSIIITVIGE
jgi:secondary thiamine-phosphate synthase enzyme